MKRHAGNGPPMIDGKRLVRKRVESLVPSPENELLYSFINPCDPEIEKLAASIKRNGCDPLTVARNLSAGSLSSAPR
jgi:hypothetical protein